MDDLICAWMSCSDSYQAARLLEEILLRHVAPLCRGVTRTRRYSAQESTDIESEVILRVVARLRAAKEGCDAPLQDARKYIVTVAFSVCHTLQRRYYPERARLKNRIRYIASHEARFAIWEHQDREWAVGLRAQRGMTPGSVADGPVLRGELSQVMHSILRLAGAPLVLDELVTAAAAVLGIHEVATVAEQDPADDRVPVDVHMAHRAELEWLWRELLLLPERQRAALLLNLRDDTGHGVIEFLPATGVASIRQIAAAVGMSAERFAELWRDLPLDDLRIAGLLDITRQQVINLRKAGRFRLLRRRQKENTAPVSMSYVNEEASVNEGASR